MKFHSVILFFALFSIAIISCDDKASNLGQEIQPVADQIYINTDTFHISSETIPVDYIISEPDSFLLGTFVDNVYGTTTADVLAQFEYRKGYKYLDSSVAVTAPDSVVLTLRTYSSFGVKTSPVEVSVYEMKSPLNYTEKYQSNIDVNQYVDFTKLIGKKATPVYLIRNNALRIKLSDEFLSRFFTTDPKVYESDDAFNAFFKGLYITTSLAGVTMLNLSDISMDLYYHYTYPDGKVVKNSLPFVANMNAKQVNRILHPDRTLTLSPNDEINYIASPANYYTRIKIPLNRMRERIKLGNKHLAVNSGILRLDVLDVDSFKVATSLPYLTNMLLIKVTDSEKTELDDFFKKDKLPDNATAFLATLGKTNITATTYKYYYSFNYLASMLEKEITQTTNDTLKMILMPVKVKYTTSSSTSSPVLTDVNQNTQMQGVGVFSGKNKKIPMKLEMVYSGF